MINRFDFLKDCSISKHQGNELPQNLLDLRQEVYVKEKGFLNEESSDAYDQFGYHILLTNNSTGKAVASIQTYKSESGEFAQKSEISSKKLTSGVTLTRLMVRKDHRGLGLGGLMLYLAMQEGRKWGRKRVFLYTEEGETSTLNYIAYEPVKNLPSFTPTGRQTKQVAANTQILELSMSRCYSQLPPEVKKFLQPFLGNEAIDTVSKRLDQFFENPWFKAIYSETLTKQQYVETLGNLYQFVRLTTRILSQAVSLSDDSGMRKHFLEHLNGEIDHEIQIESDLAQVNPGVIDFIKHEMIPSIHTQQFMVIQESLLAHNRDPLSYVAVPFSIEGFTARLDQKFIQCLENCLRKWGVPRPARGVTFFRVHIVSDGGEDGHWENNKKFLLKYIDSDAKLKKFINVIHLTMDSLENCYSSYVSEPDFEVASENVFINKSTIRPMDTGMHI